MFHDCVHGSLLPCEARQRVARHRLGLLVFTPFARWRYEHLVHHATAGDLDRRFVGDVPMLTLASTGRSRRFFRFGYRLFRNPLVMFGLGSIYSTILMPRGSRNADGPQPVAATCAHQRRGRGRRRRAVLVVGWQTVLFVELPLVVLAGSTGIWLFYVQHQFEHTYWERTDEWSYDDAALRGSSHLALPKVLQFFTGNIGFHHVHHLNPKIPNYNLQRAHDEVDCVPQRAEGVVLGRAARGPAQALGREG